MLSLVAWVRSMQPEGYPVSGVQNVWNFRNFKPECC